MAVSGTPAVWVRNAINGIWAISDGVIAVKIRIIVAARAVVVIAVGMGIIAPSWISCRHKEGCGK
jgi:hypothetical protein